MKETLYKKYYMALFTALDTMNSQVKRKDLLRNHTNYGVAQAYAMVLIDMGHEVDICVYDDGDYLVSSKIIVDGEVQFDFEKYKQ